MLPATPRKGLDTWNGLQYINGEILDDEPVLSVIKDNFLADGLEAIRKAGKRPTSPELPAVEVIELDEPHVWGNEESGYLVYTHMLRVRIPVVGADS